MPEAKRLHDWLSRRWYAAVAPFSLRPLAWIYGWVIKARRHAYRRGWFTSFAVPIPVVVVGNIVLGGTGKTPLVLWLAQQLQRRQRRVGIVIRGYGGRFNGVALVSSSSDPALVGDEAVLLAQQCGATICVARDRVAGAKLLVQQGCDLILSDDGLQHYRLQRDMEIAVVDGARIFGNGWLLPAGPLREPATRLATVDVIVCNGDPAEGQFPPNVDRYSMQLAPGHLLPVNQGLPAFPTPVPGPVHAVAGIGNPQRFFATLRKLGFAPIEHALPDHYRFTTTDLSFGDRLPIIMTEKDAVKCRDFAMPQLWFLPVTAAFEVAAAETIVQRVLSCAVGQRQKGCNAGF
jgi:tetraacyldisaccharide 4'-kinase